MTHLNGASSSDLNGAPSPTGSNVVVAGTQVRSAGETSGVSKPMGVKPPTTQLAGIGDFNADGRADILWRKSNGQLLLWFAGASGNSAVVNYENEATEVPVTTDW